MKPEDRNAYTCSEKFGFRKGSDKFKDCIFELYKAEAELEKLELQKKLVEKKERFDILNYIDKILYINLFIKFINISYKQNHVDLCKLGRVN